MLWYLLKTWQGREEDLVKEIRRTVPPYMYEEVFVIYNERIWRRQGRSIIHTEPLFKGYVFLTCRETEPLFRRMDKIPAMSRLITLGSLSMFPLMERDAEFLEQISGEDHVVRLSYALREGDGGIYKVAGPLAGCLSAVAGIEFRKRFARIEKKLWGENCTIVLGLVLDDDIGRKLICGGLEVSVEMPDLYILLEISRSGEGKACYREVKRLAVVRGGYAGERAAKGDVEITAVG